MTPEPKRPDISRVIQLINEHRAKLEETIGLLVGYDFIFETLRGDGVDPDVTFYDRARRIALQAASDFEGNNTERLKREASAREARNSSPTEE